MSTHKTLPEILRRAIEVWRQEGVKSLWFKILGETIYRRMVLMERLLDEPISEVMPRVPITTALLHENDIAEYIRFRPEADPIKVHERLASGEMCFFGGKVVSYAIVPDEKAQIQAALLDLVDRQSVDLVLTTGGTGLTLRDVTPEATLAVIEREMPGLAELMRMEGYRQTHRICGALPRCSGHPWQNPHCEPARQPSGSAPTHGAPGTTPACCGGAGEG